MASPTITKAYTATGNSSNIMVRPNERFTYTVTGTFVGTYIIEKSEDLVSWTQVATGTTTKSATTVQISPSTGNVNTYIRSRCSAYTSGTMTVVLTDITSEEVWSVTDNSGVTKLSVSEDGLAVTGNLTVSGTQTVTGAQTYTGAATFNGAVQVDDDNFTIVDNADQTKKIAFQASGITTATTRTLTVQDSSDTLVGRATTDTLTNKTLTNPTINAATLTGAIVRTGVVKIFNSQATIGGTAGWAVAPAADTGYLATCPASQTASTVIVPISGLQVGDTITDFHVVGQIESAGNGVTLDADLRKHTAAAGDPTDASVGAITQVSVTADTKVDNTNAQKTGLSEVVAQDETFYVKLTATTGASTDIVLLGIGVGVTES